MPLVTGRVVRDAWEGGYAVPACSVHSADMVDAVVEEAVQQQAPVLLQIGQRAIRHGQMSALAARIRRIAGEASVPVGIHLDHCHEVSQVVQALHAGVTSCMIDASSLPLEDNVRLTRQVVEICHYAGVPVEGELGTIQGVEDDVSVADEAAVFTDPEVAAAYVERTGVDALAVAVGSAHGMYRREPRLDLERLRAIRAAVSVPLVLHGGSGIPMGALHAAIARGIAKINFDTELRLAFMEGMAAAAPSHPEDPWAVLASGKERLRAAVREKIGHCRAAQRAAPHPAART